MISKDKILKQILEIKRESEEELKEIDTTYEEVLNNEDTTAYGEIAENNNFEAGRISACKELLKLFER